MGFKKLTLLEKVRRVIGEWRPSEDLAQPRDTDDLGSAAIGAFEAVLPGQ